MVGTSRGPYLLPQNLCSYSAHNSYANISHNYFYHQYEIPEQWRWVPGTVREFVRSKQTSYSWLDHSQEQAFQSMRKPKMMTLSSHGRKGFAGLWFDFRCTNRWRCTRRKRIQLMLFRISLHNYFAAKFTCVIMNNRIFKNETNIVVSILWLRSKICLP